MSIVSVSGPSSYHHLPPREKVPEHEKVIYNRIMSYAFPWGKNFLAETIDIISNIYTDNNDGSGVLRPFNLVDYICKTAAEAGANQWPADDVTLPSVLTAAMLYNALQDLGNESITQIVTEFENKEKEVWKIFDRDMVNIPTALITEPGTDQRYPRDDYNQLVKLKDQPLIYRAVFIASVINDLQQEYATYPVEWLQDMIQDLFTGTFCDWKNLFDQFEQDLKPFLGMQYR